MFARDAELPIGLEQLLPEKRREIPRQDAKSVVAGAPLRLDEKRGVRQARDQATQGR